MIEKNLQDIVAILNIITNRIERLEGIVEGLVAEAQTASIEKFEREKKEFKEMLMRIKEML